MTVIVVLLLLAAAICFLLGAFGVPVRVNLLALGLLFWVCVPLIAAVQGL
jgi:hypothetical protein